MELLTIAEVCERYKIKRSVVYKKIHSSEWASFVSKIGGFRVIRDGLEKWIEAGGELASERTEKTAAERRRAPRMKLPNERQVMPPGFRVIERFKRPKRDS